jgi:hypothetical protein
MKSQQATCHFLLAMVPSFRCLLSTQLGLALPSVIHPSAASASPRRWLVMQNPKSHARPTKSGLGILTSLRWFMCTFKLQKHCPELPNPFPAQGLCKCCLVADLWHSQDSQLFYFDIHHICNYHKEVNVSLLH